MTYAIFAFIGVGFLLGFRHAFEADHLAAVSTLASRAQGWRTAAWLGISWGTGHTASVACVALLVSVLGIRVPSAFYAAFELTVAVLLIGLGVSTLLAEARRHRTNLGAAHAKAHRAHAAHEHPERIRSVRGAFGFGVAHGLAGSGAVIVLLVAAATTAREQFAYLLAFGLGTVGGMSVVSLLVSGVAGLAVARSRQWMIIIRLGAATASLAIGITLGWSVVAAA